MRKYVELQVLRPVPRQQDTSFRAATKPFSTHALPQGKGEGKNSLLRTFIMVLLGSKNGQDWARNSHQLHYT